MLGRASSVERGSARLAERRRTRRRRVFVAFFALLLLLLSATIYGLWQSAVRVSNVEIFGADPRLADIAIADMKGSYLGIVPRDSVFFFPAERIRSDILASDRNIAAVSIFRSSLTSISVKIDNRASIARWCPSTSSGQAVSSDENCYVFDASGFIYAPAASTTQTINAFTLYAPLEVPRGGPPAVSEVEPLHATIAHAEKLPATFDFARQLATLGSPVTAVIIRDGEVDDILASGTRITYTLGNEQDAYTALISASAGLNLADGSIDYIDLRFDGKVYLKKK